MKELTETLRKAKEMLANGNMSEGAEFIRSAADRGELEAIHALGDLYLKGIGVERSAIRAMEYFNKAIQLGYSPAMISLAQMYAQANGVASDVNKAIELCELAGVNGSPEGFTIIGLTYEFGQVVDLNLAAQYFQKAVDARDPDGFYHLCRFYMNGKVVPKNVGKAFQLCQQAADAGSVDGIFALADLYETGYEGHTQDLTLANSLHRKAAGLGHETSKTALKRFPPVVKLGAISCSPGIAGTLQQPDLKEVLDRHKSGNWGDVDSSEWKKNDKALAEGRTVRSIHQAPQFTVVIQTAADRSSTYVEFLNEDFSNQPIDYLESAERAVRLFNLMRTIYGWM